MPHQKEPPRPKIPSPPFLHYFALTVLLLRRAHVHAHVLGNVLLHKEHGLVTADLKQQNILSVVNIAPEAKYR